MKIAIIGYGKMGKMIEDIALSRGHEISLKIDLDNAHELNSMNLENIDVAIEFSSPEAGKQNIISCLKAGTPVVSGTTGWLADWEEVTQLVEEYKGALFYASNYSIGVNILFAINSKLASIMEAYPQYDVSMEEIHHIHKADAPSGTAISLADQITGNIKRKSGWTLDMPTSDEVGIEAKREGEVPGFHSVTYDSNMDTISISHNAKSRVGFATGAVLAAEFINGKSGVFSMNEMLNF